jgi:ferredoxin-NADP reductase
VSIHSCQHPYNLQHQKQILVKREDSGRRGLTSTLQALDSGDIVQVKGPGPH